MPKQSDAQGPKPARILFLLDASGSMSNTWQKQESRFEAASGIILSIMDSIYAVNPSVSFGLRAFGEQYPAKDSNCYDTKLEVPFAFQNKGQIQARLTDLRPRGFSPIALSLQEAAENDFIQDDQYAYSIILITDGGESCGGDICATVQNLLSKKISFTPYILTLVDYQPIRDEYNCLGKVLTVANEKEIGPAVHKIIGENRKVLAIKAATVRNVSPRKTEQPKPPVLTTHPMTSKPLPVTPLTPEPENISPKQQLNLPKPIDRVVQIRRPGKANILYALPALKPVAFSGKPITLPLPEEPDKPVIKPTPEEQPRPATHRHTGQPAVTAKKTSNTVEAVPFYTATDVAEKTTMEVYFTDGKGKYYYTEPLMKLMDNASGKEIKEIYRNLSGSQPVPIPMTAGVYDIIIPGSKSKAVHIAITANKTNRVYIKAGMASLAFDYSTKPHQPVKEFKAYVSQRFGASRAVTTQPCDTMLPYEPANYHVEINTLPKSVFNIDLNFNELKIITIPTPGTFQILNSSPMEDIQLWYQLGNEYVPFLTMKISGRPSIQKVDLLPGFYQVRYFKSPRKPYDTAHTVPFQIKSEKTTQVTLDN
ncbi:MAG TPA: VWA domain-containing protein [Edaphocola sp.]|nr:VWA domain-containing protein [Edaphocola sp.]